MDIGFIEVIRGLYTLGGARVLPSTVAVAREEEP